MLQARGELDEALRIHREEELPVYERLGDVRATAVTQGYIADVLQARGELDEALRIRREQELPVYERLSDIREKALTQSKIAQIYSRQQNFQSAIQLFRDEVIPAFQTLGVKRDIAFTQHNLAHAFLNRKEGRDIRRAEELFSEALSVAEEMRIPEADEIRKMLKVCERLRKQQRRR